MLILKSFLPHVIYFFKKVPTPFQYCVLLYISVLYIMVSLDYKIIYGVIIEFLLFMERTVKWFDAYNWFFIQGFRKVFLFIYAAVSTFSIETPMYFWYLLGYYSGSGASYCSKCPVGSTCDNPAVAPVSCTPGHYWTKGTNGVWCFLIKFHFSCIESIIRRGN